VDKAYRARILKNGAKPKRSASRVELKVTSLK
jgi:hypothetical protein